MNRENITTTFSFKKRQDWIKKFFDFDIKKFERLLQEKDESYWERLGEQRALHLFHRASQDIPAYKDFLKKNKLDPSKIKTINDFKNVPITTKNNYLDKYPLEKKLWGGKMSSDIVAVSSGTSGLPRLWPRSNFQEFEAAIVHELLYNSFFDISKQSTLLIVGLPLGIYVSGVATALPSWLISSKSNYKLTIAAVGNKKDEIIDLLKKTHTHYDQIIIVGHPFFVKDVIETQKKDKKINGKNKIKFLFTSEGYSEEWRKYVLSSVNKKFLPHDAINIYGTTDTLVMGYETPTSIYVKELAEEKKSFREKANLPENLNLFQYNPYLRYLEEEKNNLLLVTSASGVPLIRFKVGDRGQIFSFNRVKNLVNREVDSIKKSLRNRGWNGKIWNLPFLALLGRSDYAVEFHVAHVRPEYIHFALDNPAFFKKITGKFSMRKYLTQNLDPILEINIELNKGQGSYASLSNELERKITEKLRQCDYRYDFLYSSSPKTSKPRIKLWPYQHEKYFKSGTKPKYIVK